MNIYKSLFIATIILLLGCGPNNDAEHVSTLNPGEKPEQQVVEVDLSLSLAPAKGFKHFGTMVGDRSFHSDIAYYETILSYGPIIDPRPIFLLTNSYIVTNQQKYGLSFLERVLKIYDKNISDDVKSTYLSAYALLRATYADQVPITARIFWLLDTFDLLEEANNLSPNNPLVHWSAGLIYAQVPWFFGKKDKALEELLWLVEHPELEPTPGFYREVYNHLAKLYNEKGDMRLTEKYLKKSGYEDYKPKTLFMGWFATTKDKGLRFAPTPWIEEIVPGRIFAVRGFGFSDMHFIVSDDGKELISIDAGTQPYSMRAAYEYLLEIYPDLPKLTTVFVTHAHWDHIGGYTYIKSLDPDIEFYGRSNYHDVIGRVLVNHRYKQFRGASFKDEWVSNYAPDIKIDEREKVIVGGTEFELIPVTGGETEDALIIYIPNEDVAFMGDALMPFYGEPWVQEGHVDGAMDTMDIVLELQPKMILHGHYGITILYDTPEKLYTYRHAYEWLLIETIKYLNNGYSAEDIIKLNLIPPGLQNNPDVFLSYLAPRDHIISRTGDSMVGIWREDKTGNFPDGLDNITASEYGRLLEIYLDMSPKGIEKALQKIIDGGDIELALQMAVAAGTRFPENEKIIELKEQAADRLRSKNQFFDPFKFVTYTELIDKEHKPIPEGEVQ